MKIKMKIRWMAVLILTALLFFTTSARAEELREDKYVIGGTYTLAEGETLDGNLYVLGGLATLELNSLVDGDIILAGGSLRVAGEVDGDITATAGLVTLESTAVVDGDIVITAANLERDPGAAVQGEVTQQETIPFSFGAPSDPNRPAVQVRTNPFWRASWLLFRSFLWAGLAILAVLFLPQHTERAANAALAQPVIAAGIGLVTMIVAPILILLSAITIIGIPVALVGALALAIAWTFGVISVGTEVGRRVAILLKQDWALAVSAGVGAFILTLMMNLFKNIWCVGWMIPALIGVIGLGAVLLTRFGVRPYQPLVSYTGPVQPAAQTSAIGPSVYQPPSPPSVGDEDR